jgi:hypothetical protein
MTTKVKNRPRVGDTCWMVEWCSALAFDEVGDVDRDNCTDVVRRVATMEEAEALARKVWPATTNTFGVVSYWPAEFVGFDELDAVRYPHAGYWEATADAQCYEGD